MDLVPNGRSERFNRILSGFLLVAAAVAVLSWIRIGLFAVLDVALNRAGIFMEPEPIRQILSVYELRPLTAQSAETPQLTAAVQSVPRLLVGDPRRIQNTGSESGRSELFRACLYVMFHNADIFFFGVAPLEVGQTVFGVCGVDHFEAHAHNFVLQMGICFGVPTMLATIAFLLSLAVRGVRVLRQWKTLPANSWMILLVVLCMVTQDTMEAYLRPDGTLIPIVFYVFSGWILVMDRELRQAPYNSPASKPADS